MIYFFNDDAGSDKLIIKGEMFKYLVKVRRHSLGDELHVRTKNDITLLHLYRVASIESRALVLELSASKQSVVESDKELHIAWCIIDAKSIEKVLPSLCEIGVSRISFLSCQRSQKNFKLDFKRFERIVEASMQQSGRTSLMQFDRYKSVESFIREYPDTKVFDFCERTLDDASRFKQVLIGCEGGFSPEEKLFLESQEVFRLKTDMVLRSESAVMAIASKILL